MLRIASLLLPSWTFGSIEKSREPIRGPISLCGICRHRIVVVQASHRYELVDDGVLGSSAHWFAPPGTPSSPEIPEGILVSSRYSRAF